MLYLLLYGYAISIALQSRPPDLGSTALNVAAWLLVLMGATVIALLTFIWNRLESRMKNTEHRTEKNAYKIQENKHIINRLDRNFEELDKLAKRNDERLRKQGI